MVNVFNIDIKDNVTTNVNKNMCLIDKGHDQNFDVKRNPKGKKNNRGKEKGERRDDQVKLKTFGLSYEGINLFVYRI